MRELERKNTLLALEMAQWRVSGPNGAAKLLGVKPTTLTDRMKKFELREALVAAECIPERSRTRLEIKRLRRTAELWYMSNRSGIAAAAGQTKTNTKAPSCLLSHSVLPQPSRP